MDDKRRRKRRRKPPFPWVKAIVFAVVGCLVVALLYLLFIVAPLSGGVDELFNRPGPYENDKKVVAAKAKEAEQTAARVDALSQMLFAGSKAFTVSAANDWQGSSCQTGQHNWKIDDPFDLSCDLFHARVAVGTLESFEQDGRDLDRKLAADGWVPAYQTPRNSLSGVLDEYWVGRQRWDEKSYGPGVLPTAKYQKQFVSPGEKLDAQPGEPKGPTYLLEVSFASGGDNTPRRRTLPLPPENSGAPAPSTTADQYLINLVLKTTYFEE